MMELLNSLPPLIRLLIMLDIAMIIAIIISYLKYDWLPDEFMGGKQAERYTALYETYTPTYSKDDSCWVYESEGNRSPLYPSTVQPSFAHFREFIQSTIAPLDEDEPHPNETGEYGDDE